MQHTATFSKFVDKAKELVSRMTLEEKISQLHGAASGFAFPAIDEMDEAEQKKLWEKLKTSDTEMMLLPRRVDGNERLGIPTFKVTNGPSGVAAGDDNPQKPATALPAPIALAATFNVDAARRFGKIQGSESLALGNTLIEAPSVNIARVPQGGRVFEGYGEDPFLAGKIAAANIQAIQSEGSMANVKHFAANNQETNRLKIDEIIDERTLREIYLPAFEAAVKQGKVASVMSSYNRINGVFSSENERLLTEILKEEWNFEGFVFSDFGATHSTVESAMAGLDLEMPGDNYFGDALLEAIRGGEVPESVVDDKLIRRFSKMFEFGFFDGAKQEIISGIPAAENGRIAREIAEEGAVLLKNEYDLLPLDLADIKSIALIGAKLNEAETGGGGSSRVVPLYTVSPVEGLRSRVGDKAAIQTSTGENIEEAVELARGSDAAIVMMNLLTTEGMDDEIVFRPEQDELIERVAAANPKTVVVLKTGSAVLMPWIDRVSAVLEAWYPGEEDGNAVAAVLFGDVNPSGKLPLTFPRSLADLPTNTPEQFPGENLTAHYSEGIFVGYRHYDQNNIEPLFPFGHGLSYTTFDYRNLKIVKSDPATLKTDYEAALTVEFDLTNTGKRAGAEAAQIYLGLSSTDDAPQPPKKLAGFARVWVEAGETRRVSIPIESRSLSYWDVNSKNWKPAIGEIKVMAGASSRDIRLEAELSR